jgi:hypothetical protein
MSSFGHYGDGRGMGGTDFPELPLDLDKLEKDLNRDLYKTSGEYGKQLLKEQKRRENNKVDSSQLFKDKTDEWDDTHCLGSEVGPVHETGSNLKCPRCQEFQVIAVKRDNSQSELQEFPWGGNTPIFDDDIVKIVSPVGQPPSPGNVISDFLQVVCKECGKSVGTGVWSYCLEHRCCGGFTEQEGVGTIVTMSEHLIGSNPSCIGCKGYNEHKQKVETKETNPKDIIGSDKVPLGLVPAVTIAYAALGHLEGNLKYGLVNWREAGVRTSIYIDACLRHIEKFKEGEWVDKTTQVPHLANALACLSIIIDAYHSDKLVDDRPKSTDASKVIDQLSDVVKHLKTLHGDCKPTDYFIDGPRQRD